MTLQNGQEITTTQGPPTRTWRITPNERLVKIQMENNGSTFSLDLDGNVSEIFRKVQIWTNNGSQAQDFILEPQVVP